MKVIGYLLVLAGLVFASASKVSGLQGFFVNTFKLSESFMSGKAFFIGLGIIVIGLLVLFISSKKGGKVIQQEEVPIYHGKKIVGYRRG